jgi:hypothetical protein
VAGGEQGCEWDKLFPGIARRGLAASSNFWVPLWRDIYLWLGYIDASAHVAQKALNKGSSSLQSSFFPSFFPSFVG